KNRRKNGDHYWVRANAVPMVRRGQVTGYMSIRTRATAEEIAAEVDKLSVAASSAATKGGNAMQTVVKTMDDIADSTQRIGSI
ncbi:hypothetical protein NGC22_23880, partial [Enterobacter hormaechei]|nr:hypothetical protein [Enterobacter hormaechei]